MTVKDAAANSLLMFVAATCVVLIVKAIPATQPTSTAEAGANSAGTNASGAPTPAMPDGVRVYYLHGNTRCPTCRTIEAYAQEAVQSGFAEELKNRQIEWQVINYETSGNEHFAMDYNIVAPNVVLVRFKGGKQVEWKGLPEVWEHTGDKTAFVAFVQTSLREFLNNATTERPAPQTAPAAPADTSPPELPTPIYAPQNAPLPLPE